MMCHGKPGNEHDLEKDGKDPLGFAMEGWSAGDTHGAYHVVMPLETVDSNVAGFIGAGLAWTLPAVGAAVVLFAFMLRAMFGRPVATLIERVRDIAQGEGDLTKRVPVNSQDELGQLATWFNTFVSRIHDVIAEVAQNANSVAAASTEIAASSEEMSAGLKEQNTQITQISSAIEQMSSSVVEVARKSGEAANRAQESGKAATEGGQVVADTVTGMKAISEAVTAGAQSVQELGRRGEQIGEIIKVINDIADQTNLLALNAAIEAARAGEHGRGFAVVADEVRKLADRTTKATEEIEQSIRAIQTETAGAVERMNTGTSEVQAGVAKASKAGQSLESIVHTAKDVATMIQSIAAAAEEQSAASEQVSRNIESINAVTRQTTEGAGQAASAAADLSSKAERLRTIVSTFKLARSAA
jgi:methyl-accepting chemotaxis protein